MRTEKVLAFLKRWEGDWDYELSPVAIEDIIVHKPEAISLVRKDGQPKSRKAAKKLAGYYIDILDKYLQTSLGKNYSKAPLELKEAAVTAAYNAGAGNIIKILRKPLNDRDYYTASKALLNTSTIGGKASAGIARRRAEQHNRIIRALAKRQISQYSGELKSVVRSIYKDYSITPNIITEVKYTPKGLQFLNGEGQIVHDLNKPPVKFRDRRYKVPNSLSTTV